MKRFTTLSEEQILITERIKKKDVTIKLIIKELKQNAEREFKVLEEQGITCNEDGEILLEHNTSWIAAKQIEEQCAELQAYHDAMSSYDNAVKEGPPTQIVVDWLKQHGYPHAARVLIRETREKAH